ncbi:hypothetical protein [uncultured Roseobacter sp.]|uniref:hypothetical protein n=1 Tax=uncultured Roseobacter sp. TaxID=114847 RepID=UPI00262A4551|nr:hypothetical protein [uncultured Roseobacter sp.]
MGQAKHLMMEMEEALWEPAEAFFHCPVCGKEVDGEVELPVVYEESDEYHFPVSVFCFECQNRFDGWVRTDWDNCRIKLDDYPQIDVTAASVQGYPDQDSYDYDYYEWLAEQEPLSRTIREAFERTVSDIRALADGVSVDPKSQMLARMLLSQSITALEVFLADSLMVTVANSTVGQDRLFRAKSLGIGTIKFELKDAIGFEFFAREKLLEHLRAVSFHNLKKVDGLFRTGIGVQVLTEGDELDAITAAIRIRHDCVHRNGMDRDTGQVHQISKEELLDLTKALQNLVTALDRKIEKYEEMQSKD